MNRVKHKNRKEKKIKAEDRKNDEKQLGNNNSEIESEATLSRQYGD